MEESEKQHKNNFDWLKEYAWQKGQSGNPNGRPKGKSLKEYSREFLANMSEESRLEFLKRIPAESVWKMAEGNPKQDTDITSDGKVINVVVPQAVIDSFNINATNKETGGSNTQ